MIDERTLDIISSCWVKFRRVHTVRDLDDKCKHVICTFLLKIAAADPDAANDPEIAGDVNTCFNIADPVLLAKLVLRKVEAKCGTNIECFSRYSSKEIENIISLARRQNIDFKDEIARLVSQHRDYTVHDWDLFIKTYRLMYSRKMKFIKQIQRLEEKVSEESIRELKVEKIKLR